MLEDQMQHLRDLPERVTNLESQFVQLRQEMRDGFSAIRSEMKEGASQLRSEMKEGASQLRSEMREGFAELGRQMRVLHEDAISRIATIGERRQSKKR
jgi:hypothetical protein